MNELQTISQDNCVMTLKDIVDFINQKRGVVKGQKGFKQHVQAMSTIEKLASEAPSFGQAKKVCLPIYDKSGKQNGTITTLYLTAKQAIAVGAKLDNGLLMEVIDKVEELENKLSKPQQLPMIKSFNTIKVEELGKVADKLMAVADAIIAIKDDTPAYLSREYQYLFIYRICVFGQEC
jgi:hypothetical protein